MGFLKSIKGASKWELFHVFCISVFEISLVCFDRIELSFILSFWLLGWIIQGDIVNRIKEGWLGLNSYRAYFILSVSVFLCLMISLSYSTELTIGRIRLESHLSLIIFPIAVLGLRKIIVKHFNLFLSVFVFANMIACLCCWGKQLFNLFSKGDWNPYYVSLSQFLHPTNQGNHLHPSYFAMYLAFAMLIVWDKVLKDKKIKEYRKVDFLFLLMQLFFGITVLFLSSKAGIFSLIILSTILTIARMIQNKRYFKSCIDLVCIMVITILVVSNNSRMQRMTASLDENKMNEMAKENHYSSTGTRVILWKSAMNSMEDHWTFGHGIGDAKKKLKETITKQGASFRIDFDAHNQFLEFLTIMGLFGLFIFIISILYSMHCSFLNSNYLMLGFFVLMGSHFMVETMMTKVHGVMFYAFFAHLLWLKMDEMPIFDSRKNLSKGKTLLKHALLSVFIKRY